jgi:hypothetical protein
VLAAGLIRDDLEAHWLSLAWASSHPPQRPPRSPSGRAPTARRWRGRARLLSQAKGEPPGSRARPSSPRCCICIVTSAVARRTRRTNSGSSAPPATRARRAAGAGLVEWTRTKRLDEGCETPVCLVQLGSPCPGDAARHTSSGHSPYRKRSLARGERAGDRRMAGRSSGVGVGARDLSREPDNQFRASQSAKAIM